MKTTTPQGRSGKKAGKSPGDNVRTRLMDAAEFLFAERGFHGVAIRDITSQAKLQLGHATYYFATKEDLFRQVIARRADDHVAAMRAELAAVIAASAPKLPSAEQVIGAFIGSAARNGRQNDGWRNYVHLLARSAVSPDRESFMVNYRETYDPVEREYFTTLRAIFPQASEENLWAAFHFAIALGVYLLTENAPVERLSGGRSRLDLEQLCEKVGAFAAAGFFRLADM